MARVVVKLECGELTLATKAQVEAEAVGCPIHRTVEIIKGAYFKEWRAICHDCGKGIGWCGQSEKDAQKVARRHRRQRSHANTSYMYDEVFSPEPVAKQGEIDYSSTQQDNPFASWGDPPY